jgi:hypothetical protein
MTERTLSGCPEARTDGLLIEAVGDELVIFDSVSNEAHALTPLAAQVFAAADGSSSTDELAVLVSAKLGQRYVVADVDAALDELRARDLLVGAAPGGMSRRRLLQVGGVAAAGALVTTALAPAYAAASSGCVNQPTTLPSGFSDMAIIVSALVNGQTVYYALKWDAGTNAPAFAGCAPFAVGGCGGWPYGYTFATFPNCPTNGQPPTGFSVAYSSPDLYITVPAPYTLVGWVAHNGTYGCTGLCTVTVNSSGCTSVGYQSTCPNN